jgi:hypothetical protein
MITEKDVLLFVCFMFFIVSLVGVCLRYLEVHSCAL